MTPKELGLRVLLKTVRAALGVGQRAYAVVGIYREWQRKRGEARCAARAEAYLRDWQKVAHHWEHPKT